MSKSSSAQERYFVVSRQDYIVAGTKDTGYASYGAANRARWRVDFKDANAGKPFVPLKVIYGTAV